VRNKKNIDRRLTLYNATRHSFASNLVNQGVPLDRIQVEMGHSSEKMTRRYAHLNLDQRRADLQKLSLKKVSTIPRLSPGEKGEKKEEDLQEVMVAVQGLEPRTLRI